jgi:uncharacterized protein (DUF885 family)
LTDNEKLEKFAVAYFEDEDRQSPTSATALGIHRYDRELEDLSPSGIREKSAALAAFEKDFLGIRYDMLDREGQIKYRLMEERLKSSRRFFDTTRPFERDPAFYADLCVQTIFILLMRSFAPLEERLECAASRMEKMPGLLSHARKNLGNPPEIYTTIAAEVLKGAGSLFGQLIPAMAEKAPSVRERLLKGRDAAVKAMEEYASYLQNEVLPRSTGDFACGAKLMDEMLTGEHFLDYDSEALWKIGERELEKCEEDLNSFVRSAFNTSRPWMEVFREIKNNHPPADGLLKAYTDCLERAENFIVEHDLVGIPPEQSLTAMDTPTFNRPLIPHAAYMPPAAFEESQAGYLFVTPIKADQSPEDQEAQLRDSAYGKIQHVSLHETFPGHHLQMTYASRVKDPIFKRTFSLIFIEGWALYCEQMMGDLGYFDREGHLCQKEASYWRALRILLDLGLHTGRFTFDEAYRFLRSKVDWGEYIARAELKRYTRTPTHALSYYAGKIELLRIREQYKKARKDAFTLRGFHEDLLNCGSLPPKVMEWKLGLRDVEKQSAAGMPSHC